MYVLFSIASTLIIMNILVSMLNITLEAVESADKSLETGGKLDPLQLEYTKGGGRRDKVDRQLGSFVWEHMQQFVAFITRTKQEEQAEDGEYLVTCRICIF